MADHLGIQLIETSAKNATNVEQAFMALAEEILKEIPEDDVKNPLTAEKIKKKKRCFFFFTSWFRN